MGVDLSIGERVHVTGKSLGFLKICWDSYGYIAINNSFFLSLDSATPPREDYVQVDYALQSRYKV